MKSFFILLFITSFASSPLAQSQNLPQVDTTSGWQLVFSNPRYFINGLQYFPEGTVYAIAGNNLGLPLFLMRSFDRGITWDTLSTPLPTGIPQFLTTMIGYTVDYNAQLVWKTTDGGQTWKSSDRNSVAYGPIAFANKDTGVVFGPCCTALTTDGGITWKEIFTPNDINKFDASFFDSKIGYAVGGATGINSHPTWLNAGYCQKTADGGTSWTQIYTGINGDIQCCQALDENILVVGTRSSFVGRTLDGGNTWESFNLVPPKSGFWAMSFADISHGLIVGNDDASGINPHGIIFSTIDTGHTWQKQYLPNAPGLYGAAMINDNTALICGGGNIWRTTNGGNFSSVKQILPISLDVRAIPEPFSTKTTLSYSIPKAASVDVKLYDVLGKEVYHITSDGIQSEGAHSIEIHGGNLPGGVYYFILTAGSFNGMGKVTKIVP